MQHNMQRMMKARHQNHFCANFTLFQYDGTKDLENFLRCHIFLPLSGFAFASLHTHARSISFFLYAEESIIVLCIFSGNIPFIMCTHDDDIYDLHMPSKPNILKFLTKTKPAQAFYGENIFDIHMIFSFYFFPSSSYSSSDAACHIRSKLRGQPKQASSS